MADSHIMDGLRARVQGAIATNALAMAAQRLVGPASNPEKQWWNASAKIKAAQRIAGEELERSQRLDPSHDPHNDAYDALRHARTSGRLAGEIGPRAAWAAGAVHELENLGSALGQQYGHRPDMDFNRPGGLTSLGRTLDESSMDMRNNAEGLRAAREGRPIDPARLQVAPREGLLSPLYRSPPQGHVLSGRR